LPKIIDTMWRRFGIVPPLVAFAMALTATAADAAVNPPIAKTYTVSGNVTKKCSVTPTTLTVTFVRNNNGNTNPTTTQIDGVTTNSVTVTARCNAATGGGVSVVATQLASSGKPSQPYTITVSGWGSTINYTAGNATAGPSSNAATSATITVAVSGMPTSTSIGTSYTSTITLSNTAN